MAIQKPYRTGDVLKVIVPGNEIHTGCRASTDLIKQAGARAIRVNTVFARAQAEYPLQYLNRFTYRPAVGEGAKVAPFAARATAIIRNARHVMATEHQIRV